MLRACDVCGEQYEARRSTSRVCSSRCRVRKTRAKAASPTVATPATSAPVDEAAGDGPLLAATLVELDAAGRAASALGQTALLLARRLDAATREPGMGMAALARQYEATLAAAVKGAARQADPVDELRERRDRRRAG